ncbi:MAG: hypothetical protein ACRD0P_27310 [Stackebrandtia sp.]
MYPGGISGDDSVGLTQGPPDDPAAITTALATLQSGQRAFLVRGYLGFHDEDGSFTVTPREPQQYAVDGRRLDLVVQYQSRGGDVTGYLRYLREVIRRHGDRLASVQVAEEPNITDNPVLDGYYPGISDAIVNGVAAARDEITRQGLDVQVGFNTTPLFGPAASFLTKLSAHGGQSLMDAVDYVGLDLFPDVFRPIEPDELADRVTGLLRYHRQCLTDAGFPATTPIRVAENGWPTGPQRTAERQAQVLDTIVRTLASHSTELNIDGYCHFSLRDTDSANPGLFHQFGLLTDDYTPKPGFAAYRALIAEFGG